MRESCVEIDKRIEKLRHSLRSTADPLESEHINRLIAGLQPAKQCPLGLGGINE